jgi:hypothetical protein
VAGQDRQDPRQGGLIDFTGAALAPARQARIEAAWCSPVVHTRLVTGGYTQAERWQVTTTDGCTAFAKCATDVHTAAWLRTEHDFYSQVQSPHLPRLLGWRDDVEAPVLVLQDLSGADWSSHWTPDRLAAVQAALNALAPLQPPAGLPALQDNIQITQGWLRVAQDPQAAIQAGLCDAAWLLPRLPSLLRLADATALSGTQLVHLDVRSDNVCTNHQGHAWLVDWNWACRGDARFDPAYWAPSVALEGGPLPWQWVAAHERTASQVALLAGFLVSQASLQDGSAPPAVRQLQRRMAAVTLAWLQRCLGEISD